MQKWYHIIPKTTGLSSYVWVVFCILPFYFIFSSTSAAEFIFGVLMILLFFASYLLSFTSRGWPVYIWASIQMAISIAMSFLFGFIYFALFLAFFIGRIQNKIMFLTLYIVHLLSTVTSISFMLIRQSEMINYQLPFIFVTFIGVILLPFTINYRLKREKLEGQLEEAHKKISNLMILEERQRIGRDLHDTLGQKLSLIGLKSDLARKLMTKNPAKAKIELEDINKTARTALKEVREMVSDMRGTKLADEIIYVQQILDAAEIEYHIQGTPEFNRIPLLVENVISMCLKEAVTNVVKHSQATSCTILFEQASSEIIVKIQDNGTGIPHFEEPVEGHGLQGMRERLEFVNGSLDIESTSGTTLIFRVPNVIHHIKEEGSM
ncbi:histidine kinase [Alteribacillus sp. HJP-4]|uniref:sensor histidine kinase n=1 Tax=Alteribacillus sp. HJP-4 TaxID=2775394 RepID=UPI0035CD3139